MSSQTILWTVGEYFHVPPTTILAPSHQRFPVFRRSVAIYFLRESGKTYGQIRRVVPQCNRSLIYAVRKMQPECRGTEAEQAIQAISERLKARAGGNA